MADKLPCGEYDRTHEKENIDALSEETEQGEGEPEIKIEKVLVTGSIDKGKYKDLMSRAGSEIVPLEEMAVQRLGKEDLGYRVRIAFDEEAMKSGYYTELVGNYLPGEEIIISGSVYERVLDGKKSFNDKRDSKLEKLKGQAASAAASLGKILGPKK